MYSSDTVTEDADMTVAVNRAGYRITYEDEAVAYTEVPETVRMLLSQRLRWSFGMFQTAWKHKGAIRERAPVGLISIPDLVIFGYLYALLAPVADLFLLLLAWNHLFGQPTELAFGRRAGGGARWPSPISRCPCSKCSSQAMP
jgi:cellulose synthase/poly-beta-1,6-N-acetylglucosamine synthase-like glycosyltransferase